MVIIRVTSHKTEINNGIMVVISFLYFKMKLDILGHSKRSILFGLKRDIDGFTVFGTYTLVHRQTESICLHGEEVPKPPKCSKSRFH